MDINEKINMRQLAHDWANITLKRFAAQIIKKKIGQSGNLARSFKFSILNNADGPEKILISYLHYGKFSDMGVGKGQKLGDVKGNKEALTAAGVKGGRVAKKWYSKTMASETNRLADLMQERYGIKAVNMVVESTPSQIS